MDADVSFGCALAEHQSYLRSILRRRCPNRSLLDDLVQEANLRAWKYRASFRPGSQFRPWLMVLARHGATDYFRCKRGRERRHDPIEAAAPTAAPDHRELTAEGLGRMVEAGQVLSDRQRRWFLGLPPAIREMFLIAAAEPISGAEMARKMGISTGTVKSRYSRAADGAPRS